MDELLSRNFTEAVQIFSVVVGIFAVIIIVNNWMLVPLLLVVGLFWLAKDVYLVTAQRLRRLETQAKSPVFSHLNASLNGLTTIRSCGPAIGSRLVSEFDRYQDEHSGAWFLTIATSTAFGMFLDLLLVVFNAVVAYSFVLLNGGRSSFFIFHFSFFIVHFFFHSK